MAKRVNEEKAKKSELRSKSTFEPLGYWIILIVRSRTESVFYEEVDGGRLEVEENMQVDIATIWGWPTIPVSPRKGLWMVLQTHTVAWLVLS